MSKTFAQVAGAILLIATVGIVSCQALFSVDKTASTPMRVEQPGR